MIDRKTCKNCEHRPTCYTPGGWHLEPCEDWAPRHGEFVSTALAKPDDKELVAIRHAGKIELAIYSESRKAFITEKGWMASPDDVVKWWMRFEEVEE